MILIAKIFVESFFLIYSLIKNCKACYRNPGSYQRQRRVFDVLKNFLLDSELEETPNTAKNHLLIIGRGRAPIPLKEENGLSFRSKDSIDLDTLENFEDKSGNKLQQASLRKKRKYVQSLNH